MTQIERISTDQIREDQSNLGHPRSIPLSWSWVKLGDVAKGIKGKLPKDLGEQNDSRKLPYIDIKAFEKKIFRNYSSGIKVPLCSKDDVLVVWDGARCGLVGKGVEGVVGSTIMKLETDLNKSFLFYFLFSNFDVINKKPRGVGIPHVEPNLFWFLEIPLPPLEEQHKIVAKIEELFSELDSGIANLRKAKEQIKTYRRSVLAYAFSGKLVSELRIGNNSQFSISSSQLPTGWKWVKLGEVIESLQYGTSDKATCKDGGIPVLRMGNIQDGKIDFTNLKYFPSDYSDKVKYFLENDDILFNRTNSAELVGKSAVYKKGYPKSIFASYLIRVKVKKEIYTATFLNYYINPDLSLEI